MSASSHREDTFPDAPLAGTPAYASLNVLAGHTVARRDDLEALGYVVAELVMALAAAGSRERHDGGGALLPWGDAASDDELRRSKEREMDPGRRAGSALFAGLRAAGADGPLAGYFAAVRGLAYAATPDYEALRRHLARVTVTVAGGGWGGRKGASPKEAAPRRRSARRSPRDTADDEPEEEADENVENRKASGKKLRVGPARKKGAATARTVGTQTDGGAIDLCSSDDEAEAMEWEAAEEDAGEDSGEDAEEGPGLARLVVVEGPHAGAEVSFGGARPASVLVGRDPRARAAKDAAAAFALPADAAAAGAHARCVVHPKRGMFSVRVSDLSSAGGTSVNGVPLPRGKGKQAFVGDKIGVGGSVLQIRKV